MDVKVYGKKHALGRGADDFMITSNTLDNETKATISFTIVQIWEQAKRYTK